MGQAPGGTVTLLFTDLVGSTELLRPGRRTAPQPLPPAPRSCRGQRRPGGKEPWRRPHGGLYQRHQRSGVRRGDAASGPPAQSEPRRARPGSDHRRGCRFERAARAQDYFGTPVVIARRLCENADGGQILVSEVVRGLVGSRGGHTFRNLGALRLKGFAEPLPASLVLWEAAPEPPELKEPLEQEPASAVPLPPLLAGAGLTAFVGRARELELLERVWVRTQAGERQLVLLTGEPGVGKTRLATEFAVAAHHEGATVLLGRAVEEPLTPCQPFAEALGHYISSCPQDRLRPLFGK